MTRTVATFPFAVDRRLGRWNRLFAVDPARARVEVWHATGGDAGGGAAEVVVHFGRWSLRTPVANVADCRVTGPYRWWKVAGPAHLSLADRGVTFATNADRGVCLRFVEPVPALLPWRGLRHPGLTATVADPEALVAALAALGVPVAGAPGGGAPG